MRLALAGLLILPPIAFAASDVTYIRIADRDVAIWKPAAPPPASGYPLIVFSHGFTGCASQSTFLTRALAQAGYLVLAPNHKDASCKAGGGPSLGKLLSLRPEAPFRHEGEWSEETYQDRRADVEAVLDTAARGPVAGAAADMTRVAIAGHSLGGYTVLGLGGAWHAWKDSRVKAVLALSPYCSPYIANGGLSSMNVPVMYQGGTLDLGVTPTIKRLMGAYDHSSAPKYYVEFQGAGHFAWTDLNPRFQDSIIRYAVAFFDTHLRGESASSSVLSARPAGGQVSDLRVQLR